MPEWPEALKILTGSSLGCLALAVILNARGILLWRSQVEREINTIKEAAAKLDGVRLEQIAEERDDKNEYKSLCDTLKTSIEALKSAIELKRVGQS